MLYLIKRTVESIFNYKLVLYHSMTFKITTSSSRVDKQHFHQQQWLVELLKIGRSKL